MPCKHGHLSVRRTVNGSCHECFIQQKRSSYADQREDHIKYMKQYWIDNKERLSQYGKQYYADHADHLRNHSRMYYAEFIDYYREYNAQYYQANKSYFEHHNREYYATNLDYFVKYWSDNATKYNASSAKRRATLRRALPAWAELDLIQEVYDMCHEISKQTGIQHNVDHIVPLAGENVCGLHCLANLQILTETDNKKKSNKHG